MMMARDGGEHDVFDGGGGDDAGADDDVISEISHHAMHPASWQTGDGDGNVSGGDDVGDGGGGGNGGCDVGDGWDCGGTHCDGGYISLVYIGKYCWRWWWW